MLTMLDTALRYHNAGLVVLPNDPARKFPAGLSGWQTVTPTEAQIRSWYAKPGKAIGVRDREGLDFDNKGQPSADELYADWYALCETLSPGLAARLLCERTPSGGYHVAWDCPTMQGNQKLATRPPTPAELATSPALTFVSLIETRGKGGQFQVAPSPGYELLRGDWAALPSITPAERQIVMDCARALTRSDQRTLSALKDRPGDVYNADHADDALAMLIAAGWREVQSRGNAVYLCRPGKDAGVSASFGYVAPGVLYVFSANASPFESDRAYSPFAILTQMRHGGDYKAAARALAGVNTKTGEIHDTPAPRRAITPDREPAELPESQIIMQRLEALGWSFRLNLCDETIEVNGYPISDIVQAEIRVALRDIGLAKKIAAAEDAYFMLAKRNSYHPVRDYLDAIKWDGVNHILALAQHLTSNDPPVVYADGTTIPLPHIYLYRWLIGAVGKVFDGSQNAMLVWDGPQGIGKSTLAHWLCPLKDHFIEGPINPQDKDNDVRLMANWIWEVSELDATTRKADQSALKSFITKEIVTVRKSYGRHDVKKPAMASLIGTINNTSGFLADESGSRRFMTTRLIHIDRAYQRIDVSQVWAQAVHLCRAGEQGQLIPEERAAQTTINETYQVETVLTDWIERAFAFDPAGDMPYSLADIISAMERDGVRLSGSERSQAMELARVLVQRGARKVETRIGKRWFGLVIRPR